MDNVRDTLLRSVKSDIHSVYSHRSIVLGGTQASKTNEKIFFRCLEGWLILLEDLMLRQGISKIARGERRRNFLTALANSDLVDVLSFFDTVYQYLLSTDISPDGFKSLSEEIVCERFDYKRLLSPINQSLYLFLAEKDDAKKAYLLSIIAQFLRFARKLEFQDIGLEIKALADYIETEKDLEAMSYDDEEVFNKISKIIHRWFKDFHIDSLLPKHGSGSVAEGPLTLAQKYQSMATDSLVRELLSTIDNKESYRDYFPIQPGTNLARVSRTIFVPKTATKLRTISMEPCTLQYLQQGVMYALYHYIEHHNYLGVRIKLSDQSQNQLLAWEGSKYHNYGTIDLSHASDSVSWDLVRRVFKSSPSLFKWLLATRSKQTLLPNGETITLKKYAPMGSALCFPVECIIFAAIVEYALDSQCKRSKSQKLLYTVYGDDIVVQSDCYDEVCRILSLCGFSVNMTKSYNTGNYRESCGKEYYAGVDISALYYRIPFYRERLSPAAYGSMCSSANNAFGRFPLYRAYLVKLIKLATPGKVPYFTFKMGKSPHLYSLQPTNFLAKCRWNWRLQRVEGKFVSVKSKQRSQSGLHDDDLRYHMKLIEMAKRKSISHSDESSEPYALHGSVEYFCSTVLPIIDWQEHDLTLAQDWQQPEK